MRPPRAILPFRMLNLADHCLLCHAGDPELVHKRALTLVRPGAPHETWTYGELARACEHLARSFVAEGCAPGERVLVRLGNSAEYAIAFFAAVRAGLVPIPSSAQLVDEEVEFLLRDSGATVLVTDAALSRTLLASREKLASVRLVVGLDVPAGSVAPGVRVLELRGCMRAAPAVALPETQAEDPAFLIYTSGTTARPKGVLHAHRSVYGRQIVIREWEGIGRDDVVCHAGALNWTYTLGVGLMDPWSVGASVVLRAGPPDPKAWPEILEEHGVTVFATVPTLYRQILKYAPLESYSLPWLRHCLTAGEPLPRGVYDEWKRRVGRELYEALGMSEISTYISFRPGMKVKPGAAGVPQAGRRIKLLALDGTEPVPPGQIGRVAVHRSDPGLMLRYWNRPEEERKLFEGEWFFGGDLAFADEDGVLWFQGRNDEVVKSLGYRVSPIEVESALASHESVAECGVWTRPTETPGLSILVAYVRVKEGHALDAAALDAHCHAHLAAYKCPRVFAEVDALPRTANGKVQRHRLEETAKARSGAA